MTKFQPRRETVEGVDKTLTDATRHGLDEIDDGDVVVGPDPMPYVVSGGERRPIQSPEEFFAAGYEPDQVKVVDDPKLALMPIGEPITAEITAVKSFDSGTVFLGAGHYMRTWGTLNLGSGQIAARTRIYTITWFGGFHGASYVIFADANDAPVHQTETRRYGVDGTWIGRSDLTQAWWENMTPGDAGRVTQIYLFHTWAPDSFQTILDKWVAAGKSIAELAASAASVAKLVKTFV
jgi:hypothetical protein